MISITNVKTSNVVESVVSYGCAYFGIDKFDYSTDMFDKCLKMMCKMPTDKRHDMSQEYLKGISVSFDITIPVYMIPEMAQYGIVTFGGNGFVNAIVNSVSSGSQSHNLPKESRGAIEKMATELKYAKRTSQEMGSGDSYVTRAFNELMKYIPMSVEITFRASTNYYDIKRMFHNSHYSSLKSEWKMIRDVICAFPYAQTLIGTYFD